MRYRRLDNQGDMRFGHGNADFLQDTPETVAQAVVTRLRLLAGEWFLDLQEGTNYVPSIFGKHTKDSYDLVVRERVLDTAGVNSILDYTSELDPDTRKLTIALTIDTIFGQVMLQEVL